MIPRLPLLAPSKVQVFAELRPARYLVPIPPSIIDAEPTLLLLVNTNLSLPAFPYKLPLVAFILKISTLLPPWRFWTFVKFVIYKPWPVILRLPACESVIFHVLSESRPVNVLRPPAPLTDCAAPVLPKIKWSLSIPPSNWPTFVLT